MALIRLLVGVGGSISTRRRLLMEVAQSVLFYGAEIWADALGNEMHRKRLANCRGREGKLSGWRLPIALSQNLT